LDDASLGAAIEAAVREEISEFRVPADPRIRVPITLIDAGQPGWQMVALFKFAANTPPPEDFLNRLARGLDLPLLYRRTRALHLARDDNSAFAQALDILTLLDKQVRFVPAAMTICNELARHGRCSRVSLGWRHDAYVQITAISDMPRFERGMDAIQKLESAMEEAFDQDEEIILPEPDDAGYVARDHQVFAQSQGVANVVTLPLRLDEKPIGVVTLERTDRAFSADEVTALRVVLDRATRRLDELERHDGSAWRRGLRGTRNQLARLLGAEHTWWKALGLGLAGLLLVAFLCTWPYRVEGSFVVRSHTLLNLPAPFDGFLAEVPVKVGDKVNGGDILLRLDKRDLLLEQNALQAEIARYEAERAQAEVERRLADMRSATAAKEQSQANLAINRFHLTRADVTAPAPGVIIEGDLRERIGAPVRAGDILMRMTRIDEMYVEIEVPERDAYAILATHQAEIAFATLPGQRFPVAIERFEPTARVKNDGNVFVLRARFQAAGNDPWWRPGMSGVAKLEAGRRPIIWLLTHRLVDFVRLKLWL